MPYPDALGQQPLDKQQAYAALAQFAPTTAATPCSC
jgi:hypothetical protein